MRIFRRTLTVVAVAAAGTLTFALPAWAHNAHFTRDCTQVHLHLDNFQASDDTANVVDVLRDGTKIDTITFHTSSIDKDYPQSPDETVQYEAVWSRTGPDHASGDVKKSLKPVTDCDTEQPPPATPTATPTETKAAAPPKAPVPPTSSAPASPTPSKAVEASKLANTGAGNTVPLLVIGAVLVAGGGALTFVTRRRRGQRASG